MYLMCVSGDRYFSGDKAVGFVKALKNFKHRKSTNESDDELVEKKIKPGSDIYFLLDMSKSMSEEDFDDVKTIIKALLKKVSLLGRTQQGVSAPLIP